jgi:hypothetical protein
MTLIIALGYPEPASTRPTNIPVILYVGNDVDAAHAAIDAAGDSGKILEGQILQHFAGCITHKRVFER